MTNFSEKPMLTYFPIRGRGEPIRLLLEDAGIPYDDRRKFDWKSEKSNRDKYAFGQIPALSIGDFHVVQQDAIMRHIARTYDYYGSNVEEATLIDMLASAVEDIKICYVRAVYGGNFENDKIDLLASRAPTWCANIDAFIAKHGKEYSVGEKIHFADFLLYEQLLCLTYLDETLLERFTHLQRFLEKIKARPNIAEYLKSGRRPLKVNNVPFGTPQYMLDQLESMGH